MVLQISLLIFWWLVGFVGIVETASVSAFPLSGGDYVLTDVKHPRFRNASDEERLASRLFRHYDVRAGPRYNGSESTEIHFRISLASIHKLEEVKQVLNALLWLDLTWTDQRLVWNPKHYSGMKRFAVPTKRIWLPDIVLYNSAETIDTRFMYGIHAAIDYTGIVRLTPYIKVRSFCQLDLAMYPFDETSCHLKFGSWAYDDTRLALINDSSQADMSRYSESGKWQVLGTEVSQIYRERLIFTDHHRFEFARHFHKPFRQAVEEHQRDHHQTKRFSDVQVKVKLRRRFLYNYHFDIFIPCTIISAITLLCFWLDPRDGEKISLGIGLLLTFIVFMLVVNRSIPKTSEIVPLMCIYLTLIVSISGLVVALEILLLNIYGTHRKGAIIGPVPKWLSTFTFCFLAKIVRIDFSGSCIDEKAKNGKDSDDSVNKSSNESTNSRSRSSTGTPSLLSALFSRRSNKTTGSNNNNNKEWKSTRPKKQGLSTSIEAILNCVSKAERIERMNAFQETAGCQNNVIRRSTTTAEVFQRKIISDEERVVSGRIGTSAPTLPPVGMTRTWDICRQRVLLLRSVADTVGYITIRSQSEQLQATWRDEWNMVAFILERSLFYVSFFILAGANFVLLLWRPFFAHLPHGHGTFAS